MLWFNKKDKNLDVGDFVTYKSTKMYPIFCNFFDNEIPKGILLSIDTDYCKVKWNDGTNHYYTRTEMISNLVKYNSKF